MSDSKLHDKWMARSVRVMRGPFVGACGTVQRTGWDRVQVALAEPPVKKLWFRVDDLAIEGPGPGP